MERMKDKRRYVVCRVVYISTLVIGAACTVAAYALTREAIRVIVETDPALVRWLMGVLGTAASAAKLADWIGASI